MKTKHPPRLSLADLLKRRKMSLKQLIDQFGVSTYEALCIRCDRMGVSPPTENDFRSVVGDIQVSSPTEGVIVLEPLQQDDIVDSQEKEQLETPIKRRKKKVEITQE